MTWLNTLTTSINNRKVLLLLGFVFLGFYFLPYAIYGQNIYISVYDNLDSSVVWFKVLAHSGMIFADSMTIIPNMMGGLPRLSYGTEFKVIVWLYYFFDDFTAYVINDIFIHTFAFVGMFVLLSNYFIDENTPNRNFIIFTASILFSMIPFWPLGGLSVAGQPLVLWAFLNIRAHRSTKREWIILGSVPFYSSFVLAMFFFLFVIGILFLYDLIRQRKINFSFMIAIIFMIAVYLGVEYRLVANMLFDSGYVSHRVEFEKPYRDTFQTLQQVTLRFLSAHKNNYSFHYVFILPTVLFAFIFMFIKDKLSAKMSVLFTMFFVLLTLTPFWSLALMNVFSIFVLLLAIVLLSLYMKNFHMIFGLLLLQIAIDFWSEFWFHEWWKPLASQYTILETFNLSRLAFIQAPIWYILLAIALVLVSRKMKFGILFVITVLIVQSYYLSNHKLFMKVNEDQLSYRTYYDTKKYSKINEFIGKPKDSYKVVSVGVTPTIAVYNGFYTIDGYSANYPLQYKKEFRKIMKDVKSPYIIPFYDKWGSKCYAMPDGISYDHYKRDSKEINDFNLDTDQMYKMGARYVLSAYKISDTSKNNLTYLKSFEDRDGFWYIYLYELEENNTDY